MQISVKRFLAQISLLLALIPMHAQERLIACPPDSGMQRYNISIAFRDASLSGLCLLKQDGAGGMKGTMVNEFGIHLMDFTVDADRKKVKLVNVLSFLNKWYIKKVLRCDLQYLFSATTDRLGIVEKGRQVELQEDKSVSLLNVKRKITYNFGCIGDKADETKE